MGSPLAVVLGGSGFLGRHVTRLLARAGWRVRAAVRDVEKAAFLKPMGDVGQVAPVACNIRDPNSVARAMAGADAAINLVGILYETGHQSFAAVQAQGAGFAARAAAAAGVKAYVHVSAIGADPTSPAEYGRSKAAGEVATRLALSQAAVLRPSIVFGPEDDFFNRFGALARLLPVLPLIGGGGTRFQPVHVGDVAAAAVKALTEPGHAGRNYELGGPRVYSFRELMELVCRYTGRDRLLVPIPFALARYEAMWLQLLPKPLLTVDQVRLLERDNLADPALPGLADFGIEPTPVEAVVPGYLARYRRAGAIQDQAA
ncbi:MAG: complex I NDUFA9 subunit family protein [Alphaproteobacteria bacterium]|nr:complex I NDUFA9 subunit family protein [Alphaproteobacteria bacterium]